MFFYDKTNIDDVEKLIIDIKKNYELARKKYYYLNLPSANIMFFDVNKLYKIVSNYFPYSCVVKINNREYLCVNDLFYTITGRVDNLNNKYLLPNDIYKYIDDNLNKNNIKHL